MTKCYTKEEQLYALDVLKFMAEEAKWEKLCKLNEEQKEKYSKLLENFKALNEWDAEEQIFALPAALPLTGCRIHRQDKILARLISGSLHCL